MLVQCPLTFRMFKHQNVKFQENVSQQLSLLKKCEYMQRLYSNQSTKILQDVPDWPITSYFLLVLGNSAIYKFTVCIYVTSTLQTQSFSKKSFWCKTILPSQIYKGSQLGIFPHWP